MIQNIQNIQNIQSIPTQIIYKFKKKKTDFHVSKRNENLEIPKPCFCYLLCKLGAEMVFIG